MANINLQNGSDGLFDILNQIFRVQSQIDSSASDRKLNWESFSGIFGTEFTGSDWVASISTAESYVGSESASPSAVMAALRSVAEQVVIRRVDEAVNLVNKTLDSALTELASQMKERSQTLKIAAVTITVTTGGSNTGDCELVASRKTVRGADNPLLLAETIDFAAVTSSGSTAITVVSDAVRDGLSPAGFGGSGITGTIPYFSVLSGITGLSGINPFTASSSVLPGSWIANVGTLGTAVTSAQPQVSTVVVSGSPSAGTYRLTCATSSLGTQSTINLPYNATAGEIQAAIVGMTGFSRITVSSTGTTPNFTHTLTFYGMRESVTVAAVNSTTGGTFTISDPTAYSVPSLGSSPIVLLSDGSTLVSVSHLLTHLQPNTAYAVNAWLALNTAAASGVIEFSLTNGVGGTILQDDAGTDLKFTVNATSLTTAYKSAAKLAASGSPIFMTPASLPASVYLRIRCSTTLPNTRKVYIENPVCGLAIQLYVGGPFVAMFGGPLGPKNSDEWSLAVTNNRAGKTSYGMDRNFLIRERNLIIPHVSSGNTITDATLVAAGPGTAAYQWSDPGSSWTLLNDSCAVGFSPPGMGGLTGTVDGQIAIVNCT